MMYADENVTMVTCPYNPEHVVRSFRFPRHLVKCKKNYPNVQLEPCFYNFAHQIKDGELLEHFQKCPEKRRIESNRYGDLLSDYEYSVNRSSAIMDFFADELELFTPNPQRKCEKSETQECNSNQQSNEDENQLSIFKIEESFPADDINQLNIVRDNKFEDELQPLPLPKTMSKAFKIIKQY